MNKRCNILFVCYGGGHARMLAPVVQCLSENQDIKISVLALTTAALEFDSTLIKIFGYKNFFNNKSQVKKYGELLAKELDKVVDYEETVAYLGQNYLELVESLGEKGAREKYERLGRQAFEPINSLKTILQKINPDVVVSTNSPRSERAAIEAARQLDICSIALIDMFSIRCEAWFSNDDFADKVLVLSDSIKEHLVTKGRNKDSIVVTGNPAFDSLVQYYDDNKDDISAKRSSLPFTVLWASQREAEYLLETDSYGDPQLPIKLEKTLFDIFERHPNWQLVARNHPSEVQRDYPDYVAVSTQSDDLLELLSGVDVVLTLTSTLGFQGAILGAGFITVDCSVFTPTMPFSEMGFSIGVKHVAEVEGALKNLFEEKNACEHASVYSVNNATENVVREIVDMIN